MSSKKPPDIVIGYASPLERQSARGLAVDTARIEGFPGGEFVQLVQLYPQDGAPIVRALVVDRSRHSLNIHFEAADDGTLLVRIEDAR